MPRLPLTRRALLGGLAASACVADPWLAAAQDGGLKASAPQPIQVDATALPHFHRGQPGVKRFGDLEYRGGLVLSSRSPSFGEWSGLLMDADGKRLLAVADMGSWMSADIAYNEDGAPAALARAHVGPLLDMRGRPLSERNERDAESIALVEGSIERGSVLVGFERMHRIVRYEVRGGQAQAPSELLRMPQEIDRFEANAGFEAVAVLQGGPLKGSPVAFAERFIADAGYHTGWVWVEGQPRRIQLQDTDGFDITDAAGLPDGGLLILERFYDARTPGPNRQRMRIRRLLAGEIAPGARLAGHTVMQADADYEIDNMECLAVHRGGRGETVVSLMSDDNLNHPRQRTVFLQFTLVE
jgi:hypothetical protein